MRLLILLLAATLTFAQDRPGDAKPGDAKPAEAKQETYQAEIIPVKTLTGDSFDRLVNLLGVFGAKYRGDNQLRTIIVYAPKDIVDQMRHVVDQLDRPNSEAAIGRNIEMTLTLLRCSTKPPATPATLPPDMEPVARQLRAATQCKDVQLWDTAPFRLQEGRDTTENMRLPGVGGTGQNTIASYVIHPEAVYRKDQARFVRFARLQIDFKIPIVTGTLNGSSQFTYVDSGLRTAGDFQEGQKTVIGKVSGAEDGDAIFAVVALKVLD
jgi:hypothetical protein